eukprot:331839-Pleurochrysis_carterae.AAC.2
MRTRHDTAQTNHLSTYAGVSQITGHAASTTRPRQAIRKPGSASTTRPATFSQLPILQGSRHRAKPTEARSLITCARLGPPTAESFSPRLSGTSASKFNRTNAKQHPTDQPTLESGTRRHQDSPRVPTPNGVRSGCKSVQSRGQTGGLHIWVKPASGGNRSGPTFGARGSLSLHIPAFCLCIFPPLSRHRHDASS